jgi:hypothetical protein
MVLASRLVVLEWTEDAGQNEKKQGASCSRAPAH